MRLIPDQLKASLPDGCQDARGCAPRVEARCNKHVGVDYNPFHPPASLGLSEILSLLAKGTAPRRLLRSSLRFAFENRSHRCRGTQAMSSPCGWKMRLEVWKWRNGAQAQRDQSPLDGGNPSNTRSTTHQPRSHCRTSSAGRAAT